MTSLDVPPECQALISTYPLDPRVCEDAVRTSADGAVVTFTGVVRDHHAGRRVRALRYDAHPRAAEFLVAVCERRRSSNIRISAQHRIGDLSVGDIAVVVAVASAHRAEAFAICAAVIDDLKSSVPIWKYEHYDDGSAAWQSGCHEPPRPTPASR